MFLPMLAKESPQRKLHQRLVGMSSCGSCQNVTQSIDREALTKLFQGVSNADVNFSLHFKKRMFYAAYFNFTARKHN